MRIKYHIEEKPDESYYDGVMEVADVYVSEEMLYISGVSADSRDIEIPISRKRGCIPMTEVSKAMKSLFETGTADLSKFTAHWCSDDADESDGALPGGEGGGEFVE